jgi:hypothetical protein
VSWHRRFYRLPLGWWYSEEEYTLSKSRLIPHKVRKRQASVLFEVFSLRAARAYVIFEPRQNITSFKACQGRRLAQFRPN